MRYALLFMMLVAGCGSCAKSLADEPPDEHLQLLHIRSFGWATTMYEMRDEVHKTTCYVVTRGEGQGVSCLRDP